MMLPALLTNHQADTDNSLSLPDSGLSLTTLILGASGTGKTTLESVLALLGLLKGLPQIILDPTGTLSAAFLFRLLRFLAPFPKAEHELLWRRVRYIPLGATDYVFPFPIYEKRETESLFEVSERLMYVLTLASPKLATEAPVTWPATHRLGSNVGVILSALNFQLTEVEDLLFNTLEWEGRFQQAITTYPEAAQAVSYFRDYYLALSRTERGKLAGHFLDQVFFLTADPAMRLWFSAGMPGSDLEEAESHRLTLLLDGSGLTNPTARRFALLWLFSQVAGHIKQRGRRHSPLVFMADEFASLCQRVPTGTNPLASLADELQQQYYRNSKVFAYFSLQSLNQVDEQLRQTLCRAGTIISARQGTLPEARLLADLLYRKDVFRVKYWHRKWGSEPTFGSGGRDGTAHVIIDRDPEFMGLPDQLELAAQQIVSLPRFRFLTRPATMEGEVAQSVFRFSIAHLDQDPETNAYIAPDTGLISRVQACLAARSGIPAHTILKEQEARLKTGTISNLPQAPGRQAPNQAAVPVEPAAGSGVDLPAAPYLMTNGAHPKPRHKVAIPPHPTLDEQQRALLAFLIEQPDMPVSGVYKGLGLSVRKGSEIRDSLTKQGFLLELERRSGKAGAGRPMTCMMPSFQAYSQLGITPPTGRGSIIHRQLQKLVAESAGAKGYRTHVEKPLDNGTIVDVHLEKREEKIAVEIAIASRVELELAHFRNALAAGYTQVYGIFLDDQDLLARTEQAIQEAFSEDVAGRVRLLPVSKISQLGQ